MFAHYARTRTYSEEIRNDLDLPFFPILPHINLYLADDLFQTHVYLS